MKFSCKNCGLTAKIKPEMIGKTGRCPKCKTRQTIETIKPIRMPEPPSETVVAEQTNVFKPPAVPVESFDQVSRKPKRQGVPAWLFAVVSVVAVGAVVLPFLKDNGPSESAQVAPAATSGAADTVEPVVTAKGTDKQEKIAKQKAELIERLNKESDEIQAILERGRLRKIESASFDVTSDALIKLRTVDRKASWTVSDFRKLVERRGRYERYAAENPNANKRSLQWSREDIDKDLAEVRERNLKYFRERNPAQYAQLESAYDRLSSDLTTLNRNDGQLMKDSFILSSHVGDLVLLYAGNDAPTAGRLREFVPGTLLGEASTIQQRLAFVVYVVRSMKIDNAHLAEQIVKGVLSDPAATQSEYKQVVHSAWSVELKEYLSNFTYKNPFKFHAEVRLKEKGFKLDRKKRVPKN